MALGVLVFEQHRRTSQRSEKGVGGELLIQSGSVVEEATGDKREGPSRKAHESKGVSLAVGCGHALWR